MVKKKEILISNVLKDPEKRKQAKQAYLKRRYYYFFRYMWKAISQEELKENWHIEFICDELEKVGRRVIAREPKEYDLIINIPPGTTKSTMATVLFPVWLWVVDPSLRIISASFESSLSIEHAALSKDCIKSERFQSIFADEWNIRKDFDAKQLYKTNKKGERRTTSTGASITGKHAHVIICDDLIDPSGVKSNVKLDSVNGWFNGTLSSRKVDKENTPTILIMQRLHEDDPAGDWIKKAEEGRKKIRHICLPASDEFEIKPLEEKIVLKGNETTIKEQYENAGGLLDPIRLSKRALEEAEADLGSRDFAGQFGQAPRMKEGNIIKSWMLPVVERFQVPAEVFKALRKFVLDTAYETKKDSDYSACLMWAKFEDKLYLLDYFRDKLEFSGLVRQTADFVSANGFKNSPVYIEPKASGISLYQYLKKHSELLAIKYKMPGGDKEARVHAIEPFLEAQKVYLIKGTWNEQFINECTSFPLASHDEAIDCLTMACELAFNKPTKAGRKSKIIN